jgi:hypothetical protein
LACAFLAFAGGLFEQALERRALHVQLRNGPLVEEIEKPGRC